VITAPNSQVRLSVVVGGTGETDTSGST